MGVRGLTTYIARNAEQYLKPYELHDCQVVIDGDCFALQIHRWVGNCNGAFGGDYDYYFKRVCEIFKMFELCNVKPFVIFDGGYELKKIKTVKLRFRGRIASMKHVNPHDCKTIFPLMIREVFIDACKSLGVKVMRCLYEADDEIAQLSKRLNCPVISYDSDFYIHNVKYIPMISITFKLYECVTTNSQEEKSPKREYIVIDGLKKASRKLTANQTSYYYMDCCIYKTEYLIRKELSTFKMEILPLLAALLGNDYINQKVLKKFYRQLTLKQPRKKINLQQRRIGATLHWLKNETFDSAITKILSQVKKDERGTLLGHIKAAMESYWNTDCESYEFFQIEQLNLIELELNEIVKHDINESAVLNEIEDVVVEDDEGDELEEDHYEKQDEVGLADVADEVNDNDLEMEKFEEIPDWFIKKFKNCEFSRFLVNLYSLKIYISNPQVEDYNFPESNSIASEILLYIFTLLNYPRKCQLSYFKRNIKGHAVVVSLFDSIELPICFIFNPEVDNNLELFQYIFKDRADEFNSFLGKLNEIIPKLFHLYFISIYYLSVKSTIANVCHVHTLLVAFIYFVVVRDFNGLRPNKSNEKFIRLINAIPRNEVNMIKKRFQVYFKLNEKLKTKHSPANLAILHPFAEFQAVVHNLNNLNVLCNRPFESIKIHEYFNGTFFYNLYMALKSRNSIPIYIQNCIFENSESFADIFSFLSDDLLKSYIGIISCKNIKKKTKTKKNHKKRIESTESDEPQMSITGDEQSEDDDFTVSINNRFSNLLRI